VSNCGQSPLQWPRERERTLELWINGRERENRGEGSGCGAQ
jgi:hypothetical protein